MGRESARLEPWSTQRRAIPWWAQALSSFKNLAADSFRCLTASQARPRRRACSAEVFLAGFLEKQQGFHNSSETSEDSPTRHQTTPSTDQTGWRDGVSHEAGYMSCEERIGQRDVRHPPADLTVVLLADCLDRAPDILRRDDYGGSFVVQALCAGRLGPHHCSETARSSRVPPPRGRCSCRSHDLW